jgi:hypothetical protein
MEFFVSRTPILLALAILVGPALAQAQSANASINANAYVLEPLQLSAGNDLEFGDVFPGVNKAVATADAEAGTFAALGEASAPVSLTYTLPTTLLDGGNSLTIANWSSCHSATSGGSCTSWTPTSGVAYGAASFSGAGELFLRIGAEVQPTASQASGNYSAQIQLEIAYL